MEHYDVIIIGGGPAGVSAALYAVRGGLRVAILTQGGSALAKAHKIDNFYGFPNGIGGAELYRAGLDQARNLGAEILETEVTGVSSGGDGYEVAADGRTLSCRALVLACGASRLTPNIEGIRDFEGSGVSYCAVCDAFFFKKKRVAVIGNGNYALEEAAVLARVAASVTICTDGLPAPDGVYPVLTGKIARVGGENSVSQLEFADGSTLGVDGVFIALGVAGTSALALKLGAQVVDGAVRVDEAMRTNLPGLYAVGDCVGGLKQVAKAVYDGAVAGLDVVRTLKKAERPDARA